MKNSNKKSKRKYISSALIVLATTILLTGTILSSAAKIANADVNKLDNIENQIVTLDGLNYSTQDIVKIIKMTNDDVTFYIEDNSDSIVIGALNSKGDPKNIRVINLNHINN